MTKPIAGTNNRTQKGKDFHVLICDYLFNPDSIETTADGKPSTEDPRIRAMQALLEEACRSRPIQLGFLGDISANGYSHLQDIVHLPFEAKLPSGELIYNKEAAEELAVFLWDFIVEDNWWKVAPKKLKAEILSSCGGSFSLPQHAAKSGSEAIFGRVMDECKANLSPQDYAALLKNINNDGFSLPQTAAKSGSEAIFARVMDQPLDRAALEARPVLFTLLHSIAKNGTLTMFQLAAEKIKAVCGKEEYFKQLTEANKAGFTPLQSARKQGKNRMANHIEQEIERMKQILGTPSGGRY